MSFSIKQFITGIGLKPVSADPSNPTQGQLQYADGTVRAEGLWRYDGSAWQQVGSGAGSYDIFFQENLETNTSSNFTSGQNASPDAAGTGTLDGTLADEESSQISGDRSLKYTMGASSDNDFFLNDTDIALAVKQQGQFIGITFYYTYNGDDDDIRFFVLDQDDNELTQSDEYIKSASTATRFSTAVFVPSDDTALRYGFQVVTGNSSKVFIVDDIEFSTNPFVYKNLVETASVRLHTSNGFGSTANKIRRYSNIAFADSSGSYTLTPITASATSDYNLFTVTSSAANGTAITFNRKCYITATFSMNATSGFWGGLTLNSSNLTTSVASLTATEVLTVDYQTISTGGSSATWSGWVAAGDVLRPHTNGITGGTPTLDSMSLIAQAEAEHVVTPAKAVDENYIARGWSSWGSTATKIPVFSSEIVNDTGKLIEVSNTAAGGLTITALKDVVVSASYNLRSPTSSGMDRGWSLNTSSVTTNVQSLPGDEVLGYSQNSSISGENVEPPTIVNVKLQAGDVLRPHTNASGTPGSTASARISINARAANAEFLAAVPKPTYKSEEQFIGYWFGEKLYERSFDLSVAVLSNTQTTLTTIDTGLTPIELKGMWLSSSGNWHPIEGALHVTSSTNVSTMYYDVSTGVISIRGQGDNMTQERFTIKYTK